MIETFEKVSRRVVKDGQCPGCHKFVRRSTTIYQTINPLNRDRDGNLKTEADIRVELATQAEAWYPDFWHEKCKSSDA